MFDTPGFARAVTDHLGLECRALAVFEDGREEPRAGLLLFERPRGPFRTVDLPPYVPYSSLCLSGPLREAEVHRRRTPLEPILTLLSSTYDAVRLQLPPGLTDVRPIRWSGWTASPLYTYRVELGPESTRPETWSGSTRRLYQNERDRFEVEIDPRAAGVVVDLCAGSYRRHGRDLPGPSVEAVRRLVAELVERGLARILLARSRADGRAEAGVVLLEDAGCLYYWIAGSRPGPAMTVLLGSIVVEGVGSGSDGSAATGETRSEAPNRSGARPLDLVGANTPSIAEFKRGFGGRLVPYYRAETLHPVLAAIDAVRDRWSR